MNDESMAAQGAVPNQAADFSTRCKRNAWTRSFWSGVECDCCFSRTPPTSVLNQCRLVGESTAESGVQLPSKARVRRKRHPRSVEKNSARPVFSRPETDSQAISRRRMRWVIRRCVNVPLPHILHHSLVAKIKAEKAYEFVGWALPTYFY